jgi:hypothetical protein
MAMTQRPRRRPLEDRIREVFSERFDSTTALLEQFLSQESNSEEFVILLGSRLDALANLAREGRTQQERFTTFLRRYGGRRPILQQVGVPNLYFCLWRQFITLPATIESAGRLRLYDQLEDRPFIRWLVESGLPLNLDEVNRFLEYLSKIMQRRYRTTATQSRVKPVMDTEGALREYLMQQAKEHRRGAYVGAMQAVSPLLRWFTIGSLLYREYRSSAIHDFGFAIDERFFEEEDLYVGTLHHDWETTVFLEVRVSGRWLLELYGNCVRNYQRRLIETRLLPHSLFLEICEFPGELEYLDQHSVEPGRELRFPI